jgi:ABC-type branched-subunit amino acid transport system ATPase component
VGDREELGAPRGGAAGGVTTAPQLVVDRLSVHFGGVVAVDDFSMEVRPGETHGVIGPNGAGKTTLLNTISGVYRPTSGTIEFEGRPIGALRADGIARLGLARTFQNTQLFRDVSVLDNVLVGLDQHERRRNRMRRAREILTFVGLGARGREVASTLPYGEQRLLEIARALAIRPRLLLLDEPVAGMNDDEIDHMRQLLRALRDEHEMTIVMVEHVMDLVMAVCDVITVAVEGRRLTSGTPAEIRADQAVIAAYLGEEESDAQS